MNLYDYAIKMEIDGEQYYRDQAEKNQGQAIRRVFTLLAEVEMKHAALLRSRQEGEAVDKEMAEMTADQNVFSALNDFKADVTSIPRQLDVYRMALEIEQKSIDQYKKLLDNAKTDQDKQLLSFLVDQETQHYNLFDTLTTLVKRPEDWVEDAEFGKREDY
ncbi:MAG: ferritin family protein [Bacillota bacterium]|nr:ferritin family protein [Bacillota bacterium]